MDLEETIKKGKKWKFFKVDKNKNQASRVVGEPK